MENTVKAGIGVIILNEKKEVLIGKRIGSVAPFYSIPGGHIEPGETFEEAAIREIQEETNLIIQKPIVICVVNNLKTYAIFGKHYVSVILFAKTWHGILCNNEPEKCKKWFWVNPEELPQPHFDASEQAIACYLKKEFYLDSDIKHEISLASM